MAYTLPLRSIAKKCVPFSGAASSVTVRATVLVLVSITGHGVVAADDVQAAVRTECRALVGCRPDGHGGDHGRRRAPRYRSTDTVPSRSPTYARVPAVVEQLTAVRIACPPALSQRQPWTRCVDQPTPYCCPLLATYNTADRRR